MAEVNWIRGELNPPSSGEYYIILEAQQWIGDFKVGDIEITSDYFDKEAGCFDTIGLVNPSWKVLAWADMLRPDIPKDLQGRVKVYFGYKVGAEDG